MKKKSSLILDNEFLLYCEINGIDNVDKLAKETFERGFSLLKYGETPTGNSTIKEKIVEKQLPPEIKYVDREVIKEVLIEKIVEVIKEVPIKIKGDTQVVTKEIIKEVPVEKIVEITNNDEIVKLTAKNLELETELKNIKQSLEKFNKATYMKNSDLGSLYDE
jgi:hypothetical protein